MPRSSCFLILILIISFKFLQAIQGSCPQISKRSVTFGHLASIRSRFDGLECSSVSSSEKYLGKISSRYRKLSSRYRKHLNLEEICQKNNTSSIRNVSIPNLQGKIVNSCQNVDRQDQYLMQLTSKSIPFPVVCVKHHAMTGDGWLVIQQRVDGSEDFYRSWVDYREGFGDLNREFWLGLERIHQITNSARHELLVEMVTYGDEYYYARYSSFEIGNEQENYILKKLGSYSGTAGDSMRAHLGMRFSTYDNDNDRFPSTGCAVKYIGAWWYDECFKKGANLNGKYRENGWLGLGSPMKSLLYVRMMLR